MMMVSGHAAGSQCLRCSGPDSAFTFAKAMVTMACARVSGQAAEMPANRPSLVQGVQMLKAMPCSEMIVVIFCAS